LRIFLAARICPDKITGVAGVVRRQSSLGFGQMIGEENLMHRICGWILLMMAAMTAAVVGCSATTPQTRADIDPSADKALRQMSDTLATARQFSYESRVTADRISPNGQIVQVTRHAKVIVARPDKIHAEVVGDDGRHSLWYNGTRLTLLDKIENTYSTIEVPGSIDRMLDFMNEKYDVTVPLSDLLFPDPYSVLTENVKSGAFMGKCHVRKQECSHLLFTQANLDWQIWITENAPNLPCKVLIVHTNRPEQPQFEARLDNWNLSPAPAKDAFDFVAPAGAKQVPMDELLGSHEGGKP
jgi:hypothetical protein